MKLLLIRHAAAVPRGTPGVPDDERPLTREGKAKFRVAARGLARVTRRPDVLLTSPLPRARVTAEIAARAFENIAPTIEPALARSSVDGIVAALKTHPPGAKIALVGHEPLLGALLARLLGATEGGRLAFEKGGAALVDLPDGPAADGRLCWFLKPRILRTLSGPAESTAHRVDPPPVAEGREV
jgi:phosphohistidine phosphatase